LGAVLAKIKQSKQELFQHLQENFGFLKASSASFDNGVFSEAKRLAVTIRVFVHDSANSKSLLGLLGLKAKMGFLNTAYVHDPKNLLSHHGLVGMQLGAGGNRYFAPLDRRPSKYVFFPDWWNEIVITDNKKIVFCRRDLVLALANRDGGAHVDPALDMEYADLTRNHTMGWSASDGIQPPKSLDDIELHGIRQITYELVSSIERQLSKSQITV